jgi:hypothetical protein
MFNYDTSQWEQIDIRQATVGFDTANTFTITSNAGRFVDDSGNVKARTSYRVAGPVLVYPWTVSLDLVGWRTTG